MPPIFADACYWIALLLDRDALHDLAVLLSAETSHRKIVTTQMVLAETLNAVGPFGAEKRQSAVDLVRGLAASSRVDVVEQTSLQFWNAVDFYNARPDQEWGLVDCASFQLMQANNIQDALTNDHHFTQAGFTILM